MALIVGLLEFIVAALVTWGALVGGYSVIVSYIPQLDLYEPYTLASFFLLGLCLLVARTDIWDNWKKADDI